MEDPGITTMSPPKTYGKNEGVGHLEIKNQVIYHRKPLKICRLWGPMAFCRLSSCHLERCPRKRICACGLLGASTSRGEGAMWYLGSDDGREGWCISLLHEELFATPRYSVFTGRISKIVLFNMPDLSYYFSSMELDCFGWPQNQNNHVWGSGLHLLWQRCTRIKLGYAFSMRIHELFRWPFSY